MRVVARPAPKDALLQRYVGQTGCYTDCFETALPEPVALSAFIEAFYTTWLFRLERMVLTLTLRRRITDEEVRSLAEGAARFAAWRVEARAEDQILLCDLGGHTRSYLAIRPAGGGGVRLVFGSAVVSRSGHGELGRSIRLLLPLHRLYSRALLALAARSLAP